MPALVVGSKGAASLYRHVKNKAQTNPLYSDKLTLLENIEEVDSRWQISW